MEPPLEEQSGKHSPYDEHETVFVIPQQAPWLWTTTGLDLAIEKGDIESVKRTYIGYNAEARAAGLVQSQYPQIELACNCAAKHGELHILHALTSIDPDVAKTRSQVCHIASVEGKLTILMWALSNEQRPRFNYKEDISYWAALKGHNNILSWIIRQKIPARWDESVCTAAIEGKHNSTLELLRSTKPPCPWGKSCCAMAASTGQLRVLKWMRAQDIPCPWDEETYFAAYKANDHIIIEYLRKTCPWFSARLRPAIANESNPCHEHTMDFIYSARGPCPSGTNLELEDF